MSIKKIACLSLMLISSSAFAGGKYQPPEAKHYLTGFYFKLGLGGTLAQFNSSTNAAVELGNGTLRYEQTTDPSAQGTQVAGNLGFGYTYQIDSLWMIGAEFTAGFTSANASDLNISNLTSTLVLSDYVESTLNNDFALIIKPGLAIQQKTQFYALMGARWGNFENKLKTEFSSTLLSEPIGHSQSASGYVIGFTVGLGVERMLTKHWALGLEYAYTAYGDLPGISDQYPLTGFIIPDGTVDASTSGTAAASTLLLNTSYRF